MPSVLLGGVLPCALSERLCCARFARAAAVTSAGALAAPARTMHGGWALQQFQMTATTWQVLPQSPSRSERLLQRFQMSCCPLHQGCVVLEWLQPRSALVSAPTRGPVSRGPYHIHGLPTRQYHPLGGTAARTIARQNAPYYTGPTAVLQYGAIGPDLIQQ